MRKVYTPSQTIVDRIMNDYTFHPPNPATEQVERYAIIRQLALDLAMNLTSMCPESRELSIALTHLDEVVFFANASIARNEK